jgi:predicted porin
MKKSLLALAAMGAFAGAAQAQSSVTVYGIFDGGYNGKAVDTKATSSATATVVSNSDMSGNQAASSRLGFRGVEDLGGGLRATFNLEFGFDAGNGTLYTTTVPGIAGQSQSDGVRTAVVGLASKEFGALNIGRQLSGIHGIIAGNVFGGNNMVGDMTYSSFTNANAQAARISNVITRFNGLSWQSTNFAGFNARVDFASNRATGANSTPANGQNYANTLSQQVSDAGIRLNYDFKQFGFSAATYQVVNTNGNTAAATGQETTTKISALQARYRGQGLIVEATYGANSSASVWPTVTNAQLGKNAATKLSAQYNVTPTIAPFFQYGWGKSTGTNLASASSSDNKNTAYQVGSFYNMSKRTSLYAVYGYQKSEATNSSFAGNYSVEGKEVGVGLLHTF